MVRRNFPYFLISFGLTIFLVFLAVFVFVSTRPLYKPLVKSSELSAIRALSAHPPKPQVQVVLAAEAAVVSSPAPGQTIAATEAAKPVLATKSAELASPSPKPVAKPKAVEPPKVVYTRHTAQEIDSFFQRYGSQYTIAEKTLRKIAVCESGYNELAKNGIYAGLFQFSASTWASTRVAQGENPDPDLRFNAEEAIKTASFKMSKEGAGAWPECSKKPE